MAPIFLVSYNDMCGPNWPVTSIKPWRISEDDDPTHYWFHVVDKIWLHYRNPIVLRFWERGNWACL